jgi:hypothetical protein
MAGTFAPTVAGRQGGAPCDRPQPLPLRPAPCAHPRARTRDSTASPQPKNQGEKEVVPGQDFSKQKLILGTHTSENEQNYLMLAEVGGNPDWEGLC